MELGDDFLRVRASDHCSSRDNHVSTTLRGEEGEEGGIKVEQRGRERRKERNGEGRRRRRGRVKRENEEGEEE